MRKRASRSRIVGTLRTRLPMSLSCGAAFWNSEKKRAGKTLVLVTHDMATVQAYCDRAMLIHDGEQRFLGDPEEAALRYYRLNFAGHSDGTGSGVEAHDMGVTRPSG